MRRLFASAVCALSLAVPAAIAAYGSPSALLEALSSYGGPRRFSGEAHVHFPGLHASIWMKGEGHGMTAATTEAKGSVTFDMSDGVSVARLRARYIVTEGTAYVRVIDTRGFEESAMGEPFADLRSRQWISFPLEADAEDATAQYVLLQEQLEAAGIMLSTEEIRLIGDQLVDSLLSMESSPLPNGGTEYSLKLHPTFLQNLVKAWAELTVDFDSLPQEAVDELLADRDIRATQALLAKTLNIHLRVGTDASGNWKGQKFYAAFADDGIEAVLLGSVEAMDRAVKAVAPARSTPVDQLSDLLSADPLGLPFGADDGDPATPPADDGCSIQDLRRGQCDALTGFRPSRPSGR